MRRLYECATLGSAMLALLLLVGTPSGVQAQAKPVGPGELTADCAKEIKSLCPNVRPGGSRLVACLIAHEDKVSPRCRLTAYLGSGNLGNRLKELRRMAKVCSSDILQYCSGITAGGGRIYDCLNKNKATLTDDCKTDISKFGGFLKN